MSVMVLVGIMTIAVSSYLTMNNNKLFAYIQKYLGRDKVASTEEALDDELSQVEVILFGYGRVGSRLADTFNNT